MKPSQADIAAHRKMFDTDLARAFRGEAEREPVPTLSSERAAAITRSIRHIANHVRALRATGSKL